MKQVERKQIGESVSYRGCALTAHYVGPDLICRVNGIDLPNFYTNAHAAIEGGKRHLDDEFLKAQRRAEKAS